MLKTSVVKWDGTQVDLVRADDPAGFALKVLSFGLLGVTVGKDNNRANPAKLVVYALSVPRTNSWAQR